MYPTLASIRPFPANCLRNIISTPQKQPAATVHFSVGVVDVISAVAEAELDFTLEPSEVIFRRAEDVKGRKKRVRNGGAE